MKYGPSITGPGTARTGKTRSRSCRTRRTIRVTRKAFGRQVQAFFRALGLSPSAAEALDRRIYMLATTRPAIPYRRALAMAVRLIDQAVAT